jgi:hypothetical protein
MTGRDQKLSRVILGIAAFFVSLFAALPAYAVPKIVQNLYEESLARSCSAISTCTLTFSPVPAGKLLTVKYLSCRVSAGGTVAIFQVQFSVNFRHAYLVPVPVSVAPAPRTWYAGGEMLRLVEAGVAPLVTVSFVNNFNGGVACNMTGEIGPA